MTTCEHDVPPALARALDLLIDPPTEPDVSKGYLDCWAAQRKMLPQQEHRPIQAAWASPLGSILYDNAQAYRPGGSSPHGNCPIDWLDIPQGGVALDVGAGPDPSPHRWPTPPDRRARDGRRHLRADAGARGARRGGSAGRLPACDAQRLPLRDHNASTRRSRSPCCN